LVILRVDFTIERQALRLRLDWRRLNRLYLLEEVYLGPVAWHCASIEITALWAGYMRLNSFLPGAWTN